MNLDEAMTLYRATIRDLAQCSRMREEKQGDKPYAWDGYAGIDADELRVVTKDGENFGLLWEEGAYSDHMVVEVWAFDEWQKMTSTWRQETLNPNGGWSRRKVVEQCFDKHNGYLLWRLNCGHEYREWLSSLDRRIKENTLSLKPTVECHECCGAGYGLDVPDPFTEEVSV